MAIVAVLMDTSAAPGSKLDPELKAEIEKLAPGLEVGEVGENELADNAVTGPKIREGAVDTAQIAEGGVHSINLATGAVVAASIATDAVTGEKAGPGVVTAKDAAGNYIESAEWHGTAAQYAQITQPDPNTSYYIR
jgi:hypothetical protein